jgi:TolB-like protein/DNA-binding winged helix-turn-helix (wHTH) protein/cytochrome c-type biogenesis protein CcmH/NrfG
MNDENQEKICYKFADFRLETETQILSRQNEPIHLAKRPFDILLFLIENRERVVSRDELLDTFWDGHDVYDDVLRKTVKTIRQALNDRARPSRLIETRRGSGFRFIGEVEEIHSLTAKEELENRQSFASPKTSFWQSRIVLISILGLVLFLSASFAISVYLPRSAKNENRKLPKISSIAVLPLRNLTGDAANDYLSDGLSEGLINEFSRHSELKVISRSSSFEFKNKDIEPREIGEKLQVEAILEGSLRKFGDEMRLEVNLVDAADGKVLWTNDAADSSLRNIFTAQNKIACDLLTKIEAGKCSKAEAARIVDSEAYRLYLQGIQLRQDLSLEGMNKAIAWFEQALQIAPNFVEAHEAIATTYIIMDSNSLVPPRSVIEKAEFHANEALKIDENSVDALLVLSETKTVENYDLELREKLLRQAVEKNPNHKRARMWLANILTVRGKFSEAESQLLYAQQIDPLSYGVRLNLSELYLYWRKPEKTIEQADLLLDENATNASALWWKVQAFLQKGDIEKAKEFWDKLSDDDKNETAIEFVIKTGRTDEARKEIEKLAQAEKGENSPYKIGCLYAEIGDREKALAWLEKSYAARQADLISMKIDPALNSLHDDTRYQNLLRRVHLAD